MTDRDFPGAPGLRLHTPNAGGLGSMSDQDLDPTYCNLKFLRASTKDPMCCNWDPAQPKKCVCVLSNSIVSDAATCGL